MNIAEPGGVVVISMIATAAELMLLLGDVYGTKLRSGAGGHLDEVVYQKRFASRMELQSNMPSELQYLGLVAIHVEARLVFDVDEYKHVPVLHPYE